VAVAVLMLQVDRELVEPVQAMVVQRLLVEMLPVTVQAAAVAATFQLPMAAMVRVE
jgi:hypothetical protein